VKAIQQRLQLWVKKCCFRTTVVALLLLQGWQLSAQDLNFSQFYELPLLRNPALAGIFIGDIRVQSVFRNQWQSVTVPFRTAGLSTEVNFPVNDYGHYLTAGAQITHDVAGDSKLTRAHFLPVLTYHAPLNGDEFYISGSLMGGIVTSSFDPTGLRWDDQYQNGQFNPNITTRQTINQTGKNYFDIGGGIALSGPLTGEIDAYVGLGLFHANNPSIAFNTDDIRLGRKWAFNGGLSIQTSDWNRMTFYADYFIQKAGSNADTLVKVGTQNIMMLGGFYTTDLVQYDTDDKVSLSLGAVYRWNDAIVPVVRLDMKKIAVGISYDVNVSQLTKASGAQGGFEFTLAYKNAFSSRVINSYRMKCVGF
jgi:type IX secretion system PorP/SprF family membrane protein